MEELKIPKNVRQIGKIEEEKIYLEDYVITFARKQARKHAEQQFAILLGKQEEKADKPWFISGAVLVENFSMKTTLLLSNENWTQIYEEIKKYFSELEIVGGLFIQAEESGLTENIVRVCKENLKNGKVLFLYNREEKEESFYLLNGGQWVKKEGYYIYYEKNEAMQAYMISRSTGASEEIVFDDRAMKRVRQAIAAKEEQKQTTEKHLIRLMYGVSTVLAAAVLVIGVTMLDGHDKMRDMEYTLNTISDKVGQEEVTVETLNGNTQKKKPKEAEKEVEDKEEGELKENDKENRKEPSEEKVKSPKKETTDEMVEKNTNQTQEVIGKTVTYYTVKEGDTLASISMKKYKTLDMIEEIQRLNVIDDKDKIYAGEKILLP